MPQKSTITSLNAEEIAHFSKDAAHWWDESGPFAPLHRLNPARLTYIRGQICDHFGLSHESLRPFKKLKVLDIGCGGGIVSEPMARLGGDVTGIDGDAVAIKVAKEHAKNSGLEIAYYVGTTEGLTTTPPLTPPQAGGIFEAEPPRLRKKNLEIVPPRLRGGKGGSASYDIILALEIIEHVNDPAEFVKDCARLLKPGGIIVFSTLNRTVKSYALGIIAAEYILRWVPRGTHDWKKFIRPSELVKFAQGAGLKPLDLAGMVFSPLHNRFQISKTDLDVNYFLTARASRKRKKP